jgi:hypothetical protein
MTPAWFVTLIWCRSQNLGAAEMVKNGGPRCGYKHNTGERSVGAVSLCAEGLGGGLPLALYDLPNLYCWCSFLLILKLSITSASSLNIARRSVSPVEELRNLR